ncbi:hypothetical protein IFM89_004119 [Coptis chinensis]|uniref:Uncharacterized protein n=1 Tax=Coptis chinensis TaxID=261450 RepID=A0A835H1C7_9MAGN|nr:hypothetical protein IFM89_004119 [Coptis chinensis]
MVAMAGVVPSVEQKEELYDPLATPNVDKSVFSPFVSFHNFIQSGLLFTSWFVSKSTLIVNSLYAMLNYAYLAVHGSAMVGRPLWLKTSALYQQA